MSAQDHQHDPPPTDGSPRPKGARLPLVSPPLVALAIAMVFLVVLLVVVLLKPVGANGQTDTGVTAHDPHPELAGR